MTTQVFTNELELRSAESEIRAAAQKAFAIAILRSIKVGFATVMEVLREASEMQKKYSKNHDSGAV